MIYLIQPPLAQLNSPYPAPYYLKTFLENRGCQPQVGDHSIGLFERIFCRAGLERIFADAEDALTAGSAGAPSGMTPHQDAFIFHIIERFFSERDLWLLAIDRLIDFLRGRDREFGHSLALANGILPGGPRFDACIDSMDGNPLPDDAPLLASKLLADLADLITRTLDPSFSLIGYSARMNDTLGIRDFTGALKSLDGYILQTFYRPLLEEAWNSLDRLMTGGESLVLGMTIPFPGCLPGALFGAASAKARYGDRVITIAGGGYVNTELRFMEEPRFFDYFDYLSFDRGYGSLAAILEHTGHGDRVVPGKPGGVPLYKTLYRAENPRSIIRGPGILTADTGCFEALDREAVKTVFPDYTGVDFSRYLRPVDDTNPMHRLWSDGRWLKAYLAHGCYWHHCAFCDVNLDYIRGFEPLETEALFLHLADQAERTGIWGVHLVDEAAPVSSLLRLALLNREAGRTGRPLSFWGNIRFEPAFTPDIGAILAAGGLAGVSGGIEVATEGGFKRIGKGIGLKDVVGACAAFKEAGILTHAYLIYGYWDEDDQEIIDSAEILRQLFAAGLLDSAFWHKFILTRHSRIYAQWERGLHPELTIREPGSGTLFALNDLAFAGEERFDRFTEPLDRLLASWMAGTDPELPVEAAFPFPVPKPSVPPDMVEKLLDGYAQERDLHRAALPEPQESAASGISRVVFLGSRPMISPGGKGLWWRWRLEDRRLRAGQAGASAGALQSLLEDAARGEGLGAAEFYRKLEGILGAGEAKKAWKVLRNSGLAVYAVNRRYV